MTQDNLLELRGEFTPKTLRSDPSSSENVLRSSENTTSTNRSQEVSGGEQAEYARTISDDKTGKSYIIGKFLGKVNKRCTRHAILSKKKKYYVARSCKI